MELSQVLIDAPPPVSPGQVDRSPSPEESHVYASTEKRDPRDPLKHEKLEKDMIIVSCGILNFEESSFSNGKSHEFSEWFYSKHPDRHSPRQGYLCTEKGALAIFERSFRKNFSKLCEGRKVIIIDNSLIKDPRDDKYLRGHAGRHFKTVEKLVDHKDFVRMNEPLQEVDDLPVLIICACIHGRHRSVADKEVLFGLFYDRRYNKQDGNIHMLDLQAAKQWTKLCDNDCEDFDTRSSIFREAMYKGKDLLKMFFPRKGSYPPPRTGWELERVKQLKTNIERRKELEEQANDSKKREELEAKMESLSRRLTKQHPSDVDLRNHGPKRQNHHLCKVRVYRP